MNILEHLLERLPLWKSLPKEWRHKLDIQWCIFVGQSEPIHQEVRTYLFSCYLYHLLDESGDLEGVHIRLAFLRVGAYTSLSFSPFKWLHGLLPCRQIVYKFYLLSYSLLVVAKAARYVDTSYNYYNAQVSMGKAAVHCTSTQSLHCETRNKGVQIVSPRINLESRYVII